MQTETYIRKSIMDALRYSGWDVTYHLQGIGSRKGFPDLTAMKDGRTVYTTEVIVDEQEFAESKAASQNSSGSNVSYPDPAPRSAYGSVGTDGFMNIPDGIDEELPFN